PALSLRNCLGGNVNCVKNQVTTVRVRSTGHESLADQLRRRIFREQNSGGKLGRLLAQRIGQTRVLFIELNIKKFRARSEQEIELGLSPCGCNWTEVNGAHLRRLAYIMIDELFRTLPAKEADQLLTRGVGRALRQDTI